MRTRKTHAGKGNKRRKQPTSEPIAWQASSRASRCRLAGMAGCAGLRATKSAEPSRLAVKRQDEVGHWQSKAIGGSKVAGAQLPIGGKNQSDKCVCIPGR